MPRDVHDAPIPSEQSVQDSPCIGAELHRIVRTDQRHHAFGAETLRRRETVRDGQRLVARPRKAWIHEWIALRLADDENAGVRAGISHLRAKFFDAQLSE